MDELKFVLEERLGPPFWPCLAVLNGYISLPLASIFHISYGKTGGKSPPSGEIARQLGVRVARIQTLHQSTAACIEAHARIAGSKGPIETAPPETTLSPKFLTQYLMALTKGVAPEDASKDTDRAALDDGNGARIAVFAAICQVVRACPFEDVVGEDGLLVARLCECALSSCGKGRPGQEQAAALSVLEGLLVSSEKEAHSDLWQSIFPGVFLGIYRALSQPQAALEVRCGSLGVLRLLLLAVRIPKTSISGGSGLLGSTAEAMLSMLQAKAGTSPEWGASAESTVTRDDGFITNLQDRATEPLARLLRDAVAASPAVVRIGAIKLCGVLLRDTAAFWEGTSLPEAALEAGLTLRNDPDEEVRSLATTILHDYHHAPRSLGLAPSVAPTEAFCRRIRALMEGLPALAEASRTAELRRNLQLLQGYLQLLRDDPLGEEAATGLSVASGGFPYSSLVRECQRPASI